MSYENEDDIDLNDLESELRFKDPELFSYKF